MPGVINVATIIKDKALHIKSRNYFGKYEYSAVGVHSSSLLTLTKAAFKQA